MNRTFAWMLAAVLALGAIGCGSDSDAPSTGASSTPATQSTAPATTAQGESTTPRPKPPKEAFARQVFDACQQRDAAVAELTKSHEDAGERWELADVARAIVPPESARLEALEAITPPARISSRYDQFKAALRARLDALAQWADEQPTGRIPRSVVTAIEGPGQRATELGRKLHLTCSV
jgi:hypothetical protein